MFVVKQKTIKALVMGSLMVGLMWSSGFAQNSETPLSNNDVVKLTKLGLAPATIIRKIQTAYTNFDVSVDSLVSLKKQGVDKDVINEMLTVSTPDPNGGGQDQNGQGNAGYQNGQGGQGDMSYQNGQGNNPYQGGQGNTQPYQGGQGDMSYQNGQGNNPYQGGQGNAQPYPGGQGGNPYPGQNSAPPPNGAPGQNYGAGGNYNDPKTWREEGVYWYNPANAASPVVPIDATEPAAFKTGGYGTMLAQEYTYGFARNKQETVIDGAHSRLQIHNANPVFYLYTSAEDRLTPNQFALVSFIEKRASRVVVVGSSNAYGATRGIDERQQVEFSYEQVADGVYKVYSREPLKPGEYCFMYTGRGRTPFSHVVYDFGVSPQ